MDVVVGFLSTRKADWWVGRQKGVSGNCPRRELFGVRVVLVGIVRDRNCPVENVRVGALSSESCSGESCLGGSRSLGVARLGVIRLPL